MIEDKLKDVDLDSLPDEEIAFWYEQLKRQETIKEMKRALRTYLEIEGQKAKVVDTKFEN